MTSSRDVTASPLYTAIALLSKILEINQPMCMPIHWGWLVNADHFITTLPFRNGLHLPTTQCACAELSDFAKQRNGSGGREKD
jgi:hypothetical protein